MKIFVLLLCSLTVNQVFARSLDRARVLSARVEALLPNRTTLLCEDCDHQWTDGGQGVRNVEQVLLHLADDPRVHHLEKDENLAPLLAEHIAAVLSQQSEQKAKVDGKRSLCGLSHYLCELFTPKLFTGFCAVPADE